MRASGSNRFICPHNAGNSAQQQALPSSTEMSPSSSLETSPFLSSVQGREAWTNLPLRARSVCYHAQRKRSSRSYQHEHGGPHAFDIAYAQMRCDCANKVDHETNACRDAHPRSEEHTSELQSRLHLGCRLLLEKKKADDTYTTYAGASASRANAIARRAATASLSACLVVTW